MSYTVGKVLAVVSVVLLISVGVLINVYLAGDRRFFWNVTVFVVMLLIVACFVACFPLIRLLCLPLFSYIRGSCKGRHQHTNRSLNKYHDHSRRTFSFTPGIASSSATAINAETAELTLLNPVDSNLNNSITSLDITDTNRTRSRAIEQDVSGEAIVPSPVEENVAPPLDAELDPPPPSYTEALLLNPGQIEVNVIGSDTNLTLPPEYVSLQGERR